MLLVDSLQLTKRSIAVEAFILIRGQRDSRTGKRSFILTARNIIVIFTCAPNVIGLGIMLMMHEMANVHIVGQRCKIERC